LFSSRSWCFLLNGGLGKTTNQYGGFGMTTNQITLTFYYLIDRNLKLEAWFPIIDIILPCQVQGEKMQIFPLQDVSLLENEFFGMINISSWLLMTISKKWSTHSGYLLLQFSCVWNINLKDDYAFHNAHKVEDQDTNLPCGQLDDNVGISKYALELE